MPRRRVLGVFHGALRRVRFARPTSRGSTAGSHATRTHTPLASPYLPCAVVGVLKGYDPLVNLVLDDAVEYLRGAYTRPVTRTARCRAVSRRPATSRQLARAYLSTTPTPPHPHTPAPTDPADPLRITDGTRGLGLVVCRGTQVTVVCPEDELREIANPFVAPPEGEEEGAPA